MKQAMQVAAELDRFRRDLRCNATWTHQEWNWSLARYKIGTAEMGCQT